MAGDPELGQTSPVKMTSILHSLGRYEIKSLPPRFTCALFLVLLEYGTILKALSTTNRSLRSCYLEEMQILPDGQQEAIKSLQILHSDRSLFVGLNNGVLKIPLERCSMYRTEG